MKSDRLDLEAVKEVVNSLRIAAGEVEHTVDLLESKVSMEDLTAYKRMVGKVIIALYSGLADPVLEAFPDFKKEFYREDKSS
jgi:hypothetical protein